MRSHRVLLIVFIIASVSLTVGAGGFSSISADRTVTVNVVSDTEAYVEIPDTSLQCGSPPANTIFYNQLSEDLEMVTVNVSVPATENGTIQLKPKGSGTPTMLAAGESTTLSLGAVGVGEGPRLKVTPAPGSNPLPDQITISVDATTPDLSVTVDDRSYTVACPTN